MPLRILLIAPLFATSLLALPGRQADQFVPPQDAAGLVSGVAISEVAGAPFSATVVIEFQQEGPDGYSEVHRTINLIARDSHGRTHNETRRFMPESFHGSPQLTSVHLFDPQTRIRIIYEPAHHIARRLLVPKQPEAADPQNPSVHTADLGSSTLNGLLTKGSRRTFTVSAKASGTGKPVEIEDEVWYSDDLHLNLLIRHTDPRIGTQTIGLSSLTRAEPPASMFEVPQGYKLLEVTSTPDPVSAAAPPHAGLPAEPTH